MRTIKLFFFLAAAFFACISSYAQVTIGSLDAPRTGALLDLNSGAKGGLLLSNVNITNLDSIPAGTGYFPGVNTPALRDVNPELRGAIVYNTNETTGAGVYVWNGKRWWPAATPDNEQILFTIRTTDNTYSIPTAGFVGGTYNHAYDWDITVDGQPAAVGNNGHCTRAGGGDFDGIPLTLTNGVNHQIRITPHGGADPGWGNAFGYCDSIKGAHSVTNKQKLISLDAPITTMAFAPKISESATNASAMFAKLFTGCSSLTTPAVIKDTYKLPETITNLSSFLAYTHFGNSILSRPIDITSLTGWLNGNQKITILSNFLSNVHCNNNVLFATSVNLEPFAGWFKGNQEIENLSDFLAGIHYAGAIGNAINHPLNLKPLSGWFNGNTSIKNLSGFLNGSHYSNSALTGPIDLKPLSGWFNGNQEIENLSYFFYNLHSTHETINSALTDPIDLSPLSNWFIGNTSIKNLSGFLMRTHNNNTNLTAPIDFTSLSGWFTENRSMNNLIAFLYDTHANNPGFRLSGQILPDWFRTMTIMDGTPLWNVNGAFYHTFHLIYSQTNNSEPQFPGGTHLSDLGEPDVPNTIEPGVNTKNKGTYTNRDGINPTQINWK
jgi:hypothetical protein